MSKPIESDYNLHTYSAELANGKKITSRRSTTNRAVEKEIRETILKKFGSEVLTLTYKGIIFDAEQYKRDLWSWEDWEAERAHEEYRARRKWGAYW